MKRNIFQTVKRVGLVSVGLILARGAQAATTIGDTTITFDGSGLVSGSQIPLNFGSKQSPTNSPSGGVTFGGSGLGLGTPDISLTWNVTPGGARGTPINFQYSQGGPDSWNAALLNNSTVGHEHDLTFAPTALSLVEINSFNFTPYYNNDGEVFNYTVSVKDANTLATLASQSVTVTSGAAAKYGVTLNTFGQLGESLTLSLSRTGGTGGPENMAVDDVTFTEVVPEPGTVSLAVLGFAGMAWAARRRGKS